MFELTNSVGDSKHLDYKIIDRCIGLSISKASQTLVWVRGAGSEKTNSFTN